MLWMSLLSWLVCFSCSVAKQVRKKNKSFLFLLINFFIHSETICVCIAVWLSCLWFWFRLISNVFSLSDFFRFSNFSHCDCTAKTEISSGLYFVLLLICWKITICWCLSMPDIAVQIESSASCRCVQHWSRTVQHTLHNICNLVSQH